MRILIAEDEAIIAYDIKGIVECFGHTVVGIVDTTEDVLARAADLRPDIVLLDIHLRGEDDGIVAAQALHDRFHLPVVYLTAHADADTVRRASATEPFGYLVKPFDEQTLQSTLEVAGYKNQMEQRLRASEAALTQTNTQLSASVAALEQRTAEMTVLSMLGGALLRCTAIEESYAVIVASARQLFSNADGVLYIQHTHPPSVEAVAMWGASKARYPPLLPQECWAIRHGLALIESENDQACACTADPHYSSRQTICVPLVVDEDMSGMIHMRLPRTADPLLPPDIDAERKRLAIALSEQAALGMANIRLRILLRDQAVRDPLTGLFNRRYLEESLIREQRRAARSRDPIGIILLDIDHFKQVNDSWGHAAGDMVLRALGRLLMAQVRAEDIACRYGGEEFVLVLPSASEAVTLARAEAIREQVHALRLFYDGEELPPLSSSAGVAIIAEQTEDTADALRRADAALYQAKHAGRNRTVVASAPL